MDLSIIIPVYNTSQYLFKCLDSVLKNVGDSIEVIVINDGSIDDSEAVILSFKDRFPDNLKYYYKENGGLSSARNLGIDMASGKFLAFIDSDDWVEPNFAIEMLKHARRSKGSVVVCCDRDFVRKESIVNDSIVKFDRLNFRVNHDLFHGLNMSACNKIYSRSLFDDNYFPEGRIYEDIYPVSLALLKSDFVFKVNEVLYHVRKDNPSSITSSVNPNESDLVKNINDLKDIVCMDYPDTIKSFNIFYDRTLFYFITRVVQMQRLDFLHEVEISSIQFSSFRYYSEKILLVFIKLKYFTLLRMILGLRKKLRW